MARKNSHMANRESVAIPANSLQANSLQACKVNYFLKVTFSIDGCNFSSGFASVSWYPQRFLLGKPVQLWCPDIFEDHSFLSLEHSYLYRCVLCVLSIQCDGDWRESAGCNTMCFIMCDALYNYYVDVYTHGKWITC